MKIWRFMALFLCCFVGIGAFFTAPIMMSDPSGKTLMMNQMLPYMEVMPFATVFFSDFLFAGNLLFVINGICQLIGVALLLRSQRWGAVSVMLCGVMLMIWTGVQFFVFPLNPLTTLYFIFGGLEVISASLLLINITRNRKETLSC